MNKGKRFIARGITRVRAALVLFLLITLGAVFYSSPTYAAADLQPGCYDGPSAQDGIGSPGPLLKSPFGSTANLCVGAMTSGSPGYYFQVAVVLPASAVKANPQITAVDSKGNKIPMTKDLDTLYVSTIPVHIGDDNGCRGIGLKITVKLDGTDPQTLDGDLCSSAAPSGRSHDTWIRTFTAGGPKGSTDSKAKQFKGYVGINFGQAYTVDANSQYHALDKQGVTSLKITGTGCKPETCEKMSYSLTNGVLTIDATNLTPLVKYKIDMTYNVRSVIPSVPYDEWGDHLFKFYGPGDQGFALNITGDTIITPDGYSEGSLAYYDINGVASEKVTKEGTTESESTCTVEGVGWIVCPVMNFMAGLNDVLYNALQGMLNISPKIFTGDSNSDSDSDLYSAWSAFRGYANILFIVVFLVIIYSQITSVGITNYGLKKLLPKLIVAAILVNTSFYICQIAVDISNILGYGLKSLFTAIGAGITSTGEDSNWVSFMGTALVGTAAVAGGVALLMAVSVPVVLAALLSLLMVVVILILRQAIVILLIAISPLAFVAWLMPNTEKWFKKWWELFFSMLILFPIISALFGAGALASKILGSGDFGADGGVAKLAALGAAVLPLIVTVPLLQGALKATGALGAKLSSMSGKANARVGSKIKSESRLGRGINNALAYRGQSRASRQTRSLAGNRFTSGALGALGGKGYRTHLTNQASALEDKDFEEGIKAAESRFSGMTFAQIEGLANDGSANNIDRTAAVRHIMANGNFAQRQKLVESSSTMSDEQRSAVSSGVLSRGDHAIYGASIADAIKSGKITGRADTQQFVAQNIADGKVKAEAMVHDADAVKLMAEVTSGGGTYSIKKTDPVTGVASTTTRALLATEVDTVKDAATKAQRNPGTASKVSQIFLDQYARL